MEHMPKRMTFSDIFSFNLLQEMQNAGVAVPLTRSFDCSTHTGGKKKCGGGMACADGVDFGNKVLQQQVHMEIYLKVLLEVN